MEPFSELLILLGLLAQQSGENVSPERIEFTARKLFPLGVREVCSALERMLESSRRFPTVAEVKAEMGMAELSSDDEARLIADAIMNAVRKFGEIPPGNIVTPYAVEIALGEAAWQVVGRSGGWNAVVERSANETAFRAQIRDVTSAYLRTGTVERGTLPEKQMGAHEAVGEAKKMFQRLLPESPKMTEGERLMLEAKLIDLKQQRADEIAKHERAIEETREKLRQARREPEYRDE